MIKSIICNDAVVGINPTKVVSVLAEVNQIVFTIENTSELMIFYIRPKNDCVNHICSELISFMNNPNESEYCLDCNYFDINNHLACDGNCFECEELCEISDDDELCEKAPDDDDYIDDFDVSDDIVSEKHDDEMY